MTTYEGACHCGAVSFEVTAALDSLMECNCSLCSRTGWRLAFIPASQFSFRSGEDHLVDYQFGKQHLHHPFCKTCGIRAVSWGDDENGDTMYAINTRCIPNFDATGSDINHYDGAAL